MMVCLLLFTVGGSGVMIDRYMIGGSCDASKSLSPSLLMGRCSPSSCLPPSQASDVALSDISSD
jgi:hypothetical protein